MKIEKQSKFKYACKYEICIVVNSKGKSSAKTIANLNFSFDFELNDTDECKSRNSCNEVIKISLKCNFFSATFAVELFLS